METQADITPVTDKFISLSGQYYTRLTKEMRSRAVAAGIPITTTVEGAFAALEGVRDQLEFGRFEVCSLQEYHRHLR